MTLQELKQEQAKLKELLSDNAKKQNAIIAKDFSEKWGYNVGDTIEWIDGRKSYIGVIIRIEVAYSYAHYVANVFTKSGEVGKREARIWANSLETIKLISKA